MKKLLLLLYASCALVSLHAQKREEGFNYAFKPTDGAPRYYVVTEKKDTGWHRQAWYLPERGMAMEGWYKDAEGQVPHGKVVWYHASRSPKSIGSYKNGKKEGVWLQFNEEGGLTDSSFYVDGKLKGISLQFDNEGYLIDSTNFDGAGNGVQVSWYKEGQVSSAGRWINDTSRHGRWQYFHPNGKLRAIEDYDAGKRTAATCYDSTGTPLPADACEEREATFSTDAKAWARFMERNLKPDVPVKNGAPAGMYTVVIQFVVNTDGKLIDIKPLTQFGYGMEAEVERLIKASPSWVPAQQHGRKVKAYRKQPITFVVSERR
jgi:antitoxin component YwqK of YwqJK toxin-antitoxin module